MDFLKITLTNDGLLYFKWLNDGFTYHGWFNPEDGIAFVKTLLKL